MGMHRARQTGPERRRAKAGAGGRRAGERRQPRSRRWQSAHPCMTGRRFPAGPSLAGRCARPTNPSPENSVCSACATLKDHISSPSRRQNYRNVSICGARSLARRRQGGPRAAHTVAGRSPRTKATQLSPSCDPSRRLLLSEARDNGGLRPLARRDGVAVLAITVVIANTCVKCETAWACPTGRFRIPWTARLPGRKALTRLAARRRRGGPGTRPPAVPRVPPRKAKRSR